MMKIEGQPFRPNYAQGVRQNQEKTAASFTEVLSRQSQDTFTLSHSGAEAPAEAAQVNPAGSAVTIHPTDSVQVKLEKLRAIDESTDYSEMSYVEIYKSAWERYDKAFDGNLFAIMSELVLGDDWSAISNQFYTEVINHIALPIQKGVEQEAYAATGQRLDRRVANEKTFQQFNEIQYEALGYGDMTMSERRYAISAKYAGKNSVLDFFNMQGELLYSGVTKDRMGAHTKDYITAMQYQVQDFFFPEISLRGGMPSQADYDSIMRTPFNARAFSAALHEGLKGWDFGDTIASMIESTVNESLDQFMTVLDKPKNT